LARRLHSIACGKPSGVSIRSQSDPSIQPRLSAFSRLRGISVHETLAAICCIGLRSDISDGSRSARGCHRILNRIFEPRPKPDDEALRSIGEYFLLQIGMLTMKLAKASVKLFCLSALAGLLALGACTKVDTPAQGGTADSALKQVLQRGTLRVGD